VANKYPEAPDIIPIDFSGGRRDPRDDNIPLPNVDGLRTLSRLTEDGLVTTGTTVYSR